MLIRGVSVIGHAFRPLLHMQRRHVVKLVKSPDEYHATLKASEFVIAKFSASWCKPCQKSKVYVEQLSAEHPDLLFMEVDVDELPQIADEEGVNSIPMYKVYKHGKSVDVHIGGDKQQLKELLEKHHIP